MNGATRRSPTDRDRAVARLRAITLGTGLAGVAAIGGFGAIAGASYDGSTTDGALTAAVAAGQTSTSAAETTTTSSSAATPSATPAPTASSATAHATTGSS